MYDEPCNCPDCEESEVTCYMDCESCIGCAEAKELRLDTEFEIKQALGWR